MPTPSFKPGDCLLYSPKGFFGWVIATKTWHHVAHVEIFNGGTLAAAASFASRDGIGVGRYPLRTSELAYVLRPRKMLDLACANRWFERVKGTRYGWLELANFVGLPLHGGGIFCSQFAAGYYRAAGLDLFPEDPPEKIAPFQFLDLVGEAFDDVTGGDLF